MDKTTKCNHKYPHNNQSAIEYCSIYEMRTSDMYCKICGKEGSKKELEAEQHVNNIRNVGQN